MASYGSGKLGVDAHIHTYGHTYTNLQATTIPVGQTWPKNCTLQVFGPYLLNILNHSSCRSHPISYNHKNNVEINTFQIMIKHYVINSCLIIIYTCIKTKAVLSYPKTIRSEAWTCLLAHLKALIESVPYVWQCFFSIYHCRLGNTEEMLFKMNNNINTDIQSFKQWNS